MGLTTILIVVLATASGSDRPVIMTQEFTSTATCEKAKELIRETTKMRVDVLKCVQK